MSFNLIDDQDSTGFAQTDGGPLACAAGVGGTYTYFGANTGSATYTFTGLAAGTAQRLALNIDAWTGFGGAIPWQVLDSDGTTLLASGTFSREARAVGLSLPGTPLARLWEPPSRPPATRSR